MTVPAETAGEATPRPNPRKVRQGIVVSSKPDKTVVVAVTERVPHLRYRKIIQRTRKFHAHDESNSCGQGDLVRIQETRPISKLKRWRVVEIIEKAR